jgi:hypothetical protein
MSQEALGREIAERRRADCRVESRIRTGPSSRQGGRPILSDTFSRLCFASILAPVNIGESQVGFEQGGNDEAIWVGSVELENRPEFRRFAML